MSGNAFRDRVRAAAEAALEAGGSVGPLELLQQMRLLTYQMPDELLAMIASRLMALEEISGIYYDLTHKPPGTIEWE